VGRFLTSLLILALTMRGLIAVGYMLAEASTGDGGMTVIICTEHGPQALNISPDGDPLPDKTQPGAANTCPYAATGYFTFNASAEIALASTVEYGKITFRIARSLFKLTPLPGAVSARGPPSVHV
jgi:hypothetical protein